MSPGIFNSNSLLKAVKLVVAAAIIYGFVVIASYFYPNPKGVWHHDSGIYLQQGFDIFGGRPPVYPIFLKIVGQNVVRYQIGLAVLSWCFLGYTILRFPGLILGGIFSISPWFLRWNALCLTESFSHSFSALAIAFSILLVRNSKWFGPWIVSLLLFVFTRIPNVFILPFFAWPVFFCKGKIRYFIVLGVIAVIIPAVLVVGKFNRGVETPHLIPFFLKHLPSFSSHRLAGQYMLESGARPYFLARPILGDFAHYMDPPTGYSVYLTWMKLPKYAYLWILLILLPIWELVSRKKLSIYSGLIVALFFASYTQCLVNIVHDDILKTKSEIWRHLLICDCFYVFSLISAVALLKELRMKNFTSKLIGWVLIVLGVIIFWVVAYRFISPTAPLPLPVRRMTRPETSPAKLKPKTFSQEREFFQLSRPREVREYLESTKSQLINGLATVTSFRHKQFRGSWLNKTVSSCWINSGARDGRLIWQSSKCPQKRITTAVFSGVLSYIKGKFSLSVNGKDVLVFNTDPGSKVEEWENDGFRLKFFTLNGESNGPKYGVFCLTAPEEVISAGEPITLEIADLESAEAGRGYFILSQIPDTLDKLGFN